MIVAAVVIIAATIYMVTITKKWNSYSNPVVEQHIILGIYPAQDYPIDGTKSYYYEVMADVKYTKDTWPSIKQEIMKSDTLLLLHDCSGD
jgi:hypothetical protein